MAEEQSKAEKPTQAPEEQEKGTNSPLPLTNSKIPHSLNPPHSGFGLSSYGNSAGNKIGDTLSPVGKPLGKGFETVAAPIGSIVGSVVDNGIMAGGRAAGAISGSGAGAMDTSKMGESFKDLQEKRAKDAEMHEPVGGQEQTANNPLGL